MWYIITVLIFAICCGLMIFAHDGYINSELSAYQRTINEPWIHRLVALLYKS